MKNLMTVFAILTISCSAFAQAKAGSKCEKLPNHRQISTLEAQLKISLINMQIEAGDRARERNSNNTKRLTQSLMQMSETMISVLHCHRDNGHVRIPGETSFGYKVSEFTKLERQTDGGYSLDERTQEIVDEAYAAIGRSRFALGILERVELVTGPARR